MWLAFWNLFLMHFSIKVRCLFVLRVTRSWFDVRYILRIQTTPKIPHMYGLKLWKRFFEDTVVILTRFSLNRKWILFKSRKIKSKWLRFLQLICEWIDEMECERIEGLQKIFYKFKQYIWGILGVVWNPGNVAHVEPWSCDTLNKKAQWKGSLTCCKIWLENEFCSNQGKWIRNEYGSFKVLQNIFY